MMISSKSCNPATVCSRHERTVYKGISAEASIYRRIESTMELTDVVMPKNSLMSSQQFSTIALACDALSSLTRAGRGRAVLWSLRQLPVYAHFFSSSTALPLWYHRQSFEDLP